MTSHWVKLDQVGNTYFLLWAGLSDTYFGGQWHQRESTGLVVENLKNHGQCTTKGIEAEKSETFSLLLESAVVFASCINIIWHWCLCVDTIQYMYIIHICTMDILWKCTY